MQPQTQTQTTRTGFWGAFDNTLISLNNALPIVEYFWGRDERLETEQKKIEQNQKMIMIIIILVFVFLAIIFLTLKSRK